MSGHCIRGAVVDWKADEEEENEICQSVKIEIGYGGPPLGTVWRCWILKWRWAPRGGCC